MKDWTLKPAMALSLLASSLVGLGAAAPRALRPDPLECLMPQWAAQ